MIKHAVVKQKHLYNGQKNIMYKGHVDCLIKDLCTSLSYKEYDGCTEVQVQASDDELRIERKGDMVSKFHYIAGKKTKGSIMTEFGMIEIELYTHKYIKKENIIAVEYDVLQQDDVIEGYRIIWNLKEDA